MSLSREEGKRQLGGLDSSGVDAEELRDPINHSRRWFTKGLLASMAIIGSLDPKSIIDYFRNPSEKVKPKSLPKDEEIYRSSTPEKAVPKLVDTIFTSAKDCLEKTAMIIRAQSVGQVARQLEHIAVAKMRPTAKVEIGDSTKLEELKAYAKSQAKQLSGLPIESVIPDIKYDFTNPGIEALKFAAKETCRFVAPIPLSILKSVKLSEVSYVKGLSISAPPIPSTIDNGFSAPELGCMMVDCYEGEEPRRTFGRQWLHQFGFLLDYVLSGKVPSTYNDIEFAGLVPELKDVEQDRLDYPDPLDSQVFEIASLKAKRLSEILQGRMILPGDEDFGQPEQLQQELMLRRIYGTFEDVPVGYFEALTEYRVTNDDQLPLYGGQLAA